MLSDEMIRLDDIEAKAKAAISRTVNNRGTYHYLDWYKDANPATILALIKAVRAAQNAVNQGCLMHAAKGSIELIEALKELE
jgi:hypothetical protein